MPRQQCQSSCQIGTFAGRFRIGGGGIDDFWLQVLIDEFSDAIGFAEQDRQLIGASSDDAAGQFSSPISTQALCGGDQNDECHDEQQWKASYVQDFGPAQQQALSFVPASAVCKCDNLQPVAE